MELKLILALLITLLLAFLWSCSKRSESFPIILYSTPIESGSVCLQMIGKHYGIDLNLEELNELAGADKSGISIQGICDAGEAKNFKTLAIKFSFELMLDAPLPLIIHWKKNQFGVVYKMNEDKVWVADPSVGKVKYSTEEFIKGWIIKDEEEKKGIALLFELKEN